MNGCRINFDSIEWESPLEGVRFKKFTSGKKQVRLVEYAKEFVEPDWCMKGHAGYIISGEIEIDFNGNPVCYKPGDGIFIPPGDENKHRARILSDHARVFLVEDI
ncbi:MAG: cupin domain-containing protein [Spirochaetes bacterium]|jgi:quercetin dioxygenase-like cupin family protein|nr:cupin domain-containing protein [Spirochaetota bacterium]